MAELPLPNLDEIPDKPAAVPATKQVPTTVQPPSPTPTNLPKLPSFTAPKLPTIPQPNIRIPKIPWRVVLSGLGVLTAVGLIVFFLFFWKGSVIIQSTPPDSLIRLDDQVATGTLTSDLSPGTYQLSVERQDYIPYASALTLKTNEQRRLDIALRALPEPVKLSDQIVQFMTLDPERTSLLYVVPTAQTAYRLFIKDLAKPIVDEVTPNILKDITDFIWSPNRELAFFKLGEATKQYDFKRYDLVNQETHDWPTGVGSIEWRPDGEKVAYAFEPVGGERTIIRATRDNTEQERIFNLLTTTITRPSLQWSPDAKYLSLIADKLYLLDVFSKELTPLDAAGAVKAVRWLPNSSGLIIQSKDDQLSLVTLDGTVTPLLLSGRIDQIVPFADSQSLIYTQERNSRTEFSRVSLVGQPAIPYLFKAQAPLAPTNLILSSNEQTLFFVSAGNPYALFLDDGAY